MNSAILVWLLSGTAQASESMAAPLEMDRGFYDWDCVKGNVIVTIKTYECKKTGLYRLSSSLTLKSGDVIKTDLRNAEPCTKSVWSSQIKGAHCTSKLQSDVVHLSVTAYVDPVLWKDALKK